MPLMLGGLKLGRVHHHVAELLLTEKLLVRNNERLLLTDEQPDCTGRSAQLRTILLFLIEKKIIPKERFELYSVAPSFKDQPLALADRALIPVLGFPAYGVHCNGFQKEEGAINLWIGKRAADRAVDPGKFDHLIAGGQPHGLSVFENLEKEAQEEAGMPKRLVAAAKPVGCVTYTRSSAFGVRRDVLFIFDLKLPKDFIPHNEDGEVAAFHLMPLQEVYETVLKTDAFKFNVNLVLIDFFIRHGLISSDEPGYAELVLGLRRNIFEG